MFICPQLVLHHNDVDKFQSGWKTAGQLDEQKKQNMLDRLKYFYYF